MRDHRMRIPSFLIALSFVVCAPAHAHVGSADVFYENDAGPYHVFVTVRMPKVIPGLAQVEIRSESNDVHEVRLNILRLSGFGYKLQAIPDLAQRSPQDPRFFVGSIWVMETYDLQVRIQIDGARGKAELGVPMPAFAQSTLRMQKSLGALLFGVVKVADHGVGTPFTHGGKLALEVGVVRLAEILRSARLQVLIVRKAGEDAQRFGVARRHLVLE